MSISTHLQYTSNLRSGSIFVSFRFENYIPAGMAKRKESPILALAVRENVWEPLKGSGNYEREIFISIQLKTPF